MSDGMTKEMLQLGRVAYERWVEGMEGAFRPAETNRIFGLPPWINSEHPHMELPQEQKELWARVAVSARADAYAAGMEQGRRQTSGVRITEDMLNSIRSARLVNADERSYVLGILMLAGLTVIE